LFVLNIPFMHYEIKDLMSFSAKIVYFLQRQLNVREFNVKLDKMNEKKQLRVVSNNL
jgi:hypothetical protein